MAEGYPYEVILRSIERRALELVQLDGADMPDDAIKNQMIGGLEALLEVLPELVIVMHREEAVQRTLLAVGPQYRSKVFLSCLERLETVNRHQYSIHHQPSPF